MTRSFEISQVGPAGQPASASGTRRFSAKRTAVDLSANGIVVRAVVTKVGQLAALTPNKSYELSMEETIEGWYSDPYARHEARWMSEGRPTRLIRDGDVEGSDPVAGDEPFKVAPVRIEDVAHSGGSDFLRADDSDREAPFDAQASTRAAWDAFDQSGGPTR